jgi:hypothetical protein
LSKNGMFEKAKTREEPEEGSNFSVAPLIF